MNRCFVVSNFLDPLGVEDAAGPEELLTVARALAASIRDGLAREFPGQAFEVEIVGEGLVEDEPLELCVTFSRAG